MIELVLADRCVECDICVRVCPTNVFDAVPGGVPEIARQDDCQTCFLCELYCPTDALFVAPDCDAPAPTDSETVEATDWPGQYRRDSGWGRWRHTNTNESWRMEPIFNAAFAVLGIGRTPAAGQPPERAIDAPEASA